MPETEFLSCSPVRKIFFPDISPAEFNPYGGSTSLNVVEYFLGTPDITSNVLFLGSGDLRNVLVTVAQSSEAYHKFNMHLSDSCESVTVRNFLISHILLSEGFDPTNADDIQYLWNVWYGCQWNELTRKRFVKDVKRVLARKWSNPQSSVILHENPSNECVKRILNNWLTSVSNMKADFIYKIMEQRFYRLIKLAEFEEHITKKECPEDSLRDLVPFLIQKLNFLSLEPNRSIPQEFSSFLQTGDFISPEGKVVCVNPSLLTMDGQQFAQVRNLSCPLDAYFPLPLHEKMDEVKFETILSPYSYCKDKLQEFASGLRKKGVQIHVHVGDSLDLCLTSEQLKNKMHVIHCSGDLVEVAGLANILPAASGCLNGDFPEAVLVTEIPPSWLNKGKTRLADYVDNELCCPLSLVPTFYGMRLSDHLQLGSPVCLKQHDYITIKATTLKWFRTPVTYSSNVRLEASDQFKSVVKRLVEVCFTNAHTWICSPQDGLGVDRSLFLRSMVLKAALRYTPLTFYNIVKPVISHYDWTRGATETLFKKSIPPSFQLAWRTYKDWMQGKPVLLFYSDSSFLRDSILIRSRRATDVSHVQLVLKSISDDCCPAQSLSKASSDDHCVFNLNWKNPNEFTLSFLLAKDHGLDSKTQLYIICVPSRDILFSMNISNLQPKEIVNPNLYSLQPFPIDVEGGISDSGLQVVRCRETEKVFFLDVGIPGVKQLDTKDMDIVPEWNYPSFSTHQISLRKITVPSPYLVVQLPWPVQILGIECSQGPQKNVVQVVMRKSLDGPWPCEHGGRSKLDINKLRPWKDISSNGTLQQHIEAQFTCTDLILSQICCRNDESCILGLNGLREIIRAIFYSHHYNSFYLFAIYDHLNTDSPIFHLKIHPPVRFSPHGSPLLLISSYDHQLAHYLVVTDKMDPSQTQFQRLMFEGVSREVCSIRASSEEELDLLRYLFWVNCTKMRRSAWQSMNLPRGEDSAWIYTFISPLYSESISDNCAYLADKVNPPNLPSNPIKNCASCHVQKVPLKRCSRCQLKSYCSPSCQKKHWPQHRSHCSTQAQNGAK